MKNTLKNLIILTISLSLLACAPEKETNCHVAVTITNTSNK